MIKIVKVMLAEGIDEETIHRALNVIEEKYEVVDEDKLEDLQKSLEIGEKPRVRKMVASKMTPGQKEAFTNIVKRTPTNKEMGKEEIAKKEEEMFKDMVKKSGEKREMKPTNISQEERDKNTEIVKLRRK